MIESSTKYLTIINWISWLIYLLSGSELFFWLQRKTVLWADNSSGCWKLLHSKSTLDDLRKWIPFLGWKFNVRNAWPLRSGGKDRLKLRMNRWFILCWGVENLAKFAVSWHCDIQVISSSHILYLNCQISCELLKMMLS